MFLYTKSDLLCVNRLSTLTFLLLNFIFKINIIEGFDEVYKKYLKIGWEKFAKKARFLTTCFMDAISKKSGNRTKNGIWMSGRENVQKICAA